MRLYDFVPFPLGSPDLFIFNLELLQSRAGKPFLRFDLGVTSGEFNVVIRQVRLSGGVLRPPQVKLGRATKLDQALLGQAAAEALYEIIAAYLRDFDVPLELKPLATAIGRIRIRKEKL